MTSRSASALDLGRRLAAASLGALLAALVTASAACAPADETAAPVPPEPGPATAPLQAGRPACQSPALPSYAFAEGPYGLHRGELADDFTLELVDGTTYGLRARWTGCESHVVIPDTIRVSDLDPTSVWENDLDELVATSPRDAHYLFVSRASTQEQATTATTAMQQRVDALLATLAPEDAAYWRRHLHVARTRAADLGSWLGEVLVSRGRLGLAIDRFQRIRGVGYLADVSRFRSQLQQQGYWPWESNLAYAANEVRYFDGWAARQAALDDDGAHVVTLWNGAILSEQADKGVSLPSAEDMARYDTLEVEVELACPDPEKIEFGNCGAWDYLASLYLLPEKTGGETVELARFITSYHRETHWVVDASPMLAILADGGKRMLRWSFAPPWNPQPTATRLALRFSNRGKGYRPAEATFLWSGGDFGPGYDALHPSKDVAIPADAKRVELWALVTGHGGATQNCAEFCAHQHDFTVNGTTYTKSHPDVSQNDGCMPEMDRGMVPNQAGTWWFGRGGWCPGQQVEPFVADVTADVTPGASAHLTYTATLNGQIPPNGAGNIFLASYLVVYR
ncbi:MAG: hypothetical protein IT373_11035 [Polyangiaceae bacterium]|nr:hypothetical protein [Polyangiaceae bacterium]